VHGDEQQRDPADGRAMAVDLDAAREVAVDVALAVTLRAGSVAARLARATVVRPVTATAAGVLQLAGLVMPDGPRHPLVADLTVRGEGARAELERAGMEALRRILRRAVETALSVIDLTELVHTHVDLDALAATIDVDAVVARADVDAVVARADVDAVVARVDLDAALGRLDLDDIVARVDLDAVLSRVDLDAILSRVDLDAVVARVDLDGVLSRVDLDGVLSRMDLDAVLSRVDLDDIASRIDVEAIVARVEPDALVARVDIEAVVGRLDLPALTRQVIDAIDLPEILRESSGAVSSQAARVVRTEGMNADDSVARFMDRLLRRSHPVSP
jgi:hypothetical protein